MFKKIVNKRWLQHLVFWMLSFYLIGTYFSISGYFRIIDFIYSGFFHIPLLVLVYINTRLLIPKFFNYSKLYIFVLFNLFNVGLAVLVHALVFELGIPIMPIEFYIVSFTDIDILVFIFFLYLLISTLFKLSKSWFLLEQAEKENLSLELNALKSQVNPHFLFNTLNSIYSLSIQGSPNTPKIVLKLSQLLRYMLYEISDEMVDLGKEIEVMQDYLDLQKIRLDKSSQINFEIKGNSKNVLIPPLLFFPLLENSFKHGLKGTSRNSFVNVLLEINESDLKFEISNNKGSIDDTESTRYGGIGLANVQRRLNLIYGKNLLFEVQDQEDTFKVLIGFKH